MNSDEKKNIDDELAELEEELNKEEESKLKEEQKGPDLYPDIIEDKYHDIEKMISLGVLEKEKSLCNKIIKYKKKMNRESYIWEKKKKNTDKKLKSILSLIENKVWNITMYKEKIKEQKAKEEKLLELVEKELNLNEEQKEKLKERINERINIIKGELNQNVEEEEEEIIPDLEELEKEASENIDLYPNTVEDIYHNIGKMDSLGVLEKEKELCDKIINYKMNKIEEYNIWEIKKGKIDEKINSITSLVQNGTWNFDTYKNKIKEEKDWEQKLLELAKNDSSLNEAQKQMIKGRIIGRKNLIEDELKQNPEEDDQ